MHHVHCHRHGAPSPGLPPPKNKTPGWMKRGGLSEGKKGVGVGGKNGERSGADRVRSYGKLLPRTVMDVTEIVALPAAPGPSPWLQPMRRGEQGTRKCSFFLFPNGKRCHLPASPVIITTVITPPWRTITDKSHNNHFKGAWWIIKNDK